MDRWLTDISEVRKIPLEELRASTEGRVWTGRQAKERKLIDEIGGFERALEIAKEAAGIPAVEDVTLDYYPKRKGLYYLLTTGDAPLTWLRGMMARWLRADIAETVRMMQHGGEWRLWTGSEAFE
jgi:ClpP class serine protease